MDVVTARPTELDRYAALARTTGIIGIAFLVLLFGPIIALSVDEPPLDATAAEAVKNFGNLEATWAQLTMAPLLWVRIWRSSCFMQAHTPRRLIALTRSKVSAGSSAASVGGA